MFRRPYLITALALAFSGFAGVAAKHITGSATPDDKQSRASRHRGKGKGRTGSGKPVYFAGKVSRHASGKGARRRRRAARLRRG